MVTDVPQSLLGCIVSSAPHSCVVVGTVSAPHSLVSVPHSVVGAAGVVATAGVTVSAPHCQDNIQVWIINALFTACAGHVSNLNFGRTTFLYKCNSSSGRLKANSKGFTELYRPMTRVEP